MTQLSATATCGVLSCGEAVVDAEGVAAVLEPSPGKEHPGWVIPLVITLCLASAASLALTFGASSDLAGMLVFVGLFASFAGVLATRPAADDTPNHGWRAAKLLLVSLLAGLAMVACVQIPLSHELGLMTFATSGFSGLFGWGHLLRWVHAQAAERWPELLG